MNKAVGDEFDDEYYVDLMNSCNTLGNALLVDVVNDKINEKKSRIAKINISNEFINYKNQLEKLKSLKIGFIHNILNERNIEELDLHLDVSEKLLNKITQILNDHVLFDASGIISKNELDELLKSKDSLESIHAEFKTIPDRAAPYLKNIEEFQQLLKKIVDCIDKTSKAVKENQSNVLKDTSKFMDCL